jgi:hypothetical protein
VIWLLAICVALLTQCTDGSTAGQSGSVGQITDVINVESRLNNTVASGGEAIRPGAVLATDRTGVMDFRLTAFGLACRLSRAAEARVLESEQTPLHYTNGTAVCLVARDPGDTLILRAGRHTLKVVQSTFRIKFHAGGQSIAVVRGAMRVEPAPRSGDGATGQPGAPPIDLTPGKEADCEETTACIKGPTDLDEWPSEQAAAVELFTEELQRFEKEQGTAGPIPSTPDDTTPAASEQATTPNGVEEESEVADPEPTTPDDDGDEQHDDGDEQPDGTADEDEEPIAPDGTADKGEEPIAPGSE